MKKTDLIQTWKEHWLTMQDIDSVILFHTHFSQSQLFLADTIDNSESILESFEQIQAWKPIQYVLWISEFMGRNFYVDESTLIPRQDTETLVQAVLKQNYEADVQFVEIGTGSGIISITLALAFQFYASIDAYDISLKALNIAQKNAKKHGVDDIVTFWESDLLSKISFQTIHKTQKIVILANLPYIKNRDYSNMSTSTVQFEPELALYGWEKTWFEMYEKLIGQIIEKQWEHTVELFIEIGFDQHEISEKYLNQKWLNFEFYQDSATIIRVVHIFF